MSARELLAFLDSPNSEVSRVALESILQLTPSSAGQAYVFKENDLAGVRSIKKLSTQSNDDWTVQNALIALVNLSDDKEIRTHLSADSHAVKAYAKMAAANPKFEYSKYACMLLSNLSREKETIDALQGALLLALILTFVKIENTNDESYDYLAFAFSEVARQSAGAIAKQLPYLYSQLTAPSLPRRKGVAATLKNALFEADLHQPLVEDTPLIETIMICLKGPETLDAEDAEKLPPSVRKELSASKMRESDLEIQILLLECLLLLSSTQIGRDTLRSKNAYFVVRELHKTTEDPIIAELCEKYVNMVLRGDPEANRATEVSTNQEDDEGVTEVV